MKTIIALKTFFFQGELIKEDEEIEVDKEAYTQLVKEEKLCKEIK